MSKKLRGARLHESNTYKMDTAMCVCVYIYIYICMEASVLYPHRPKKSDFFEKKQILQNNPKTHVWLKTDLIIVTGVIF